MSAAAVLQYEADAAAHLLAVAAGGMEATLAPHVSTFFCFFLLVQHFPASSFLLPKHCIPLLTRNYV